MIAARVSVVIPSFNQASYLEQALQSVFDQGVAVEVSVLDGGSTDGSQQIIERWAPKLAFWRSGADGGQAAAINEGIALGSAPYVCWLNSDDMFVDGGLAALVDALDTSPDTPAAYGRTWDLDQRTGQQKPTWVEPFSERQLAVRCIVSQPGSLMRRDAWEAIGGLDPQLHMALDYDLWWRLYRQGGPLAFVNRFVAVNRLHEQTKTRRHRSLHYKEAIAVVRRHHGSVPLKWWIARPYQVWYRSGFTQL